MKARISKRELNRSYIRVGMMAMGFSRKQVDEYMKNNSAAIEEYLDLREEDKAAFDKKLNEAKEEFKADPTISEEVKNFFLN